MGLLLEITAIKNASLWPISPDWRIGKKRGKYKSRIGVKKRRVVMRSKWFLWVVAILIGSALAFAPMVSAAEKEKKVEKKAAAGEMKEEKKDEKKAEKKDEKKAVKKDSKKAEKKDSKKAEKKDDKKEEKK